MNRRMGTLVVAVTTLCVAGCGYRGGLADVSGKVTLDDRPLPNVEVRLFESRGGSIYDTKKAVRTDSGGGYRLSGLLPGTYRAEISKEPGLSMPGYDANSGRLQFTVPEMKQNQTLTQDFALKSKP